MPDINERTLVLAIQAIDKEIHALQGLAESDVLDSDEEFLVSLENAAEGLKEAYENAYQEATNLPPYRQLVRETDDGEDV
jgi:predicted  nucleic acid-binding Zn-ribbon protein